MSQAITLFISYVLYGILLLSHFLVAEALAEALAKA